MDEETLVAGLRAGDSEIQQRFWQQYWDILYPISAHILGAGPDAVDVAVELLVDFMEHGVDNLSHPKGLYPYLRLAVVRRAIRFRKRQSQNEPLSPELFDAYDITPEAQVTVSSLMPRLAHCLKEISPKAQQMISLKFISEWPLNRIGSLVGGSKQYISRTIQKSLVLLKSCIERKDDRVTGEV